jgi:hypothetical protein
MAQHTTVAVPAEVWTQLTNGDATAVTFQNRGGLDVYIAATTNTTAPTSLDTALVYGGGQGERGVDIADLFPGLAGADRLWAYSPAAARVFISHA